MRKKVLRFILIPFYIVLVALVGVALLEVTARSIGLGDPVIYYNSVWGGLRPLPDQQVSRIKNAQITIDQNGFRTATAASDEALRILYIGDSVTWGGSSIDDRALFTEVASDIVRGEGYEVYSMNAGVNGTSLMNHAGVYEQHRDSVDAVVWLFPWGDVTRTYVTGGFLWPPLKKPRYALVEAIDQVIRAHWLPRFRLDDDQYQEAFLQPEIPQGYGAFYDGVFEEREEKNIEALLGVTKDAVENGVPLLVGITPRHTEGNIDPLPAAAAQVLAGLDTSGVHLLDLHASLGRAGNVTGLYVDPVHFSTDGHQAVGDALGKEILKMLRVE